MTDFRQFWRTRAAKIAAVATVLAVGGFGMAVSGGNSVAADESSSSRWSGGWPATSAGNAARSTQAIEAAAAARGALVLRARTLREAGVDANADGEGPGDYFVFEEALRRPGSARRVGTDSVRCMLNVRTFMCDGSLRIDGVGKISIQGSLFYERDNVLSVTGGSGKYRHATGRFRVFDRPGGATLFVIDIRTR